MTEFGFEPIYGSVLTAIVSALAVAAVIAWFTPPLADPNRRRWLIALRSIAALAILLAIFRPALIRTDNRPADATLVVGVDLSRSMTMPDNEDGDRWSTQQEVWQKLAEGLKQFDETLDVQLFGYERTAESLPSTEPDALQNLVPKGNLTDLATAANFALQTAGSNPLAGVVFLGDGRQTARPSDLAGGMDAQRSIETLNSLGVPFWTVPIGPAAGSGGSRDVAVEALEESFQLFAGNEFEVSFQLITRGLAGVDVPIKLTWINQNGGRTEALSRLIVPEKSDETSGMKLDLVAPEPGAYRLEVQAEKQSGELVTQNNRQISFVEIREGGGRILYLEGIARPEQTFLRRALRGFPDLDLRYKWIRQDRTWPVDLGDRFKPSKFDIYILGDVDADALGREQLAELQKSIAKGAGLITLGGFQSYGRGGYAKSPLADVLPIQMDSSRRRDIASDVTDQRDTSQIRGEVLLQPTRNHPIIDLGGEDPDETWKKLAPMQGANRLVGPKVAPGVQVVLQNPNKEPMMVLGEYGSGRVASLAFDSTYRWWRNGQSDAHRRFWRQTMLWLLSREESGGDKIRIELDSRRFALAEPPEFRASLESVLSSSTQKRELIAEVIDETGKATSVPVSTQSVGQDSTSAINGKLPELEAGIYRLRVKTKNDSSVEPAELAFQATDKSRELASPMADPVYLRQLAQITSGHGGGAFSPEEVDDLIETIGQRRRQAEIPIIEKLRLGDGPVSGWILFAVFAGALSAEWYLRRRWDLA